MESTLEDWLTNYARDYRYTEIPENVVPDTRFILMEKMNDALPRIIEKIHFLSGTTEADI